MTMMSKGWIAGLAAVVMAMASSAQADVVIDQSRIRVASPVAPLMEQIGWPGTKWHLDH